MTHFRSLIGALFFTIVFAAVASADHNHLSLDTSSGAPGEHIEIRAGYYPAETTFTISNHRLLFNGAIAVYDVPDQISQAGQIDGWHVGDELLLTSDFYFATGRIDGGDFRYELAGVQPVSGGPGVFAWGDFDALGGFTPIAFSNASTREARSFDVGLGGHDHEQGYVLTGGWVQDLTIIAWDAQGRYSDSAPLTIRFDTGECPADFNREGGVTVQDIFDYLSAWFVNDVAADFNHAGGISVQDIFDYLNAWFTGC